YRNSFPSKASGVSEGKPQSPVAASEGKPQSPKTRVSEGKHLYRRLYQDGAVVSGLEGRGEGVEAGAVEAGEAEAGEGVVTRRPQSNRGSLLRPAGAPILAGLGSAAGFGRHTARRRAAEGKASRLLLDFGRIGRINAQDRAARADARPSDAYDWARRHRTGPS